MSNPLLGALTKGALKALPYIQGLVSQGNLSPTQILSAVRAAGFSLRTQTGLDVIGILQNNVNTARLIRVTPANVPLDPKFYGRTTGVIDTQFSYLVKATFQSATLGLQAEQFVTVSSDVPLTKDQILATGEAYATGGNYAAGMAVSSLEVTEARASADYEG